MSYKQTLVKIGNTNILKHKEQFVENKHYLLSNNDKIRHNMFIVPMGKFVLDSQSCEHFITCFRSSTDTINMTLNMKTEAVKVHILHMEDKMIEKKSVNRGLIV